MMALHRDLGILPGGRHGHGRSAARGRVFNDEDRTAHERSSYCAVDRPPISEIEYSGSWLPRTHVGGRSTAQYDDRSCAVRSDRKSTRLNSSHLVISYAV